MKVTLFTTDKTCQDIVDVKIAHMTMFENNTMKLTFISDEEQSKFILACIKHYVLIQIQGSCVSIIPESNNYQRVRFRFDS